MLWKRDCKQHDPTTPRGKLGRANREGGSGWSRPCVPLHHRRRLRFSFRSNPSFQSSTVADGSQALGMNEGALCRLKQSPPLSPPFSPGCAFVRCPHRAPIAPLPRLVPATGFLLPRSTQGTGRAGESGLSPRPNFGQRSRFLPRPASSAASRAPNPRGVPGGWRVDFKV